MKQSTKRIILRIVQLVSVIPVLLASVAFVHAQNGNDPKKAKKPTDRNVIVEQVSKLNEEYSFMIQRGNAAEIEPVLADDYVLTDESGKVFTKTDDLATYKDRKIKIEFVKTLDQKLRVVGDGVVIANAKINFKGTRASGATFDITEQCTTIWAWRDGRWQIVSDHISFVKP